MMDDADIKRLEQKLLALRDELRGMEASSREDTRPVKLDQSSVGRLSRMDAMQAQQMAQETARRRQRQLQKVDAALGRIESGDYGYCFACDEEIDLRRLEADPTHTRCVRCADS